MLNARVINSCHAQFLEFHAQCSDPAPTSFPYQRTSVGATRCILQPIQEGFRWAQKAPRRLTASYCLILTTEQPYEVFVTC